MDGLIADGPLCKGEEMMWTWGDNKEVNERLLRWEGHPSLSLFSCLGAALGRPHAC